MSITKLKIFALHDMYDYDIDFNERITFLYGENGCGKTTVLNIMSAIMTGRVHLLFQYRFKKIELYYHDDNTGSKENEVLRVTKHGKYIEVKFKNHEEKVDFGPEERESLRRKGVISHGSYRNRSNTLKNMQEFFKYVYLPLNRSQGIEEDDIYFEERRMPHFYRRLGGAMIPDDEIYYANNTYLAEALVRVSDLVMRRCSEISFNESRLGEEFKKNVFNSTLNVSNTKISDIQRNLDSNTWAKFTDDIKKYSEIMKDLYKTVLADQQSQLGNPYEDFIEEFESLFKKYKDSQLSEEEKNSLFIKYLEFEKIVKIADLAKEVEDKKIEFRKPRKIFLDLLNKFVNLQNGDKKVIIDNEGEIKFEISNGNKLPVYKLSSGEKQIVILLASLIFDLSYSSSGIYIIDEPESSLHLAWQKILVDSVMEANPNLQLILATHSPEIIGNKRDDTVYLKPVNQMNSIQRYEGTKEGD